MALGVNDPGQEGQEPQGGSGLRQQLEEALATNRTLTERLTTYEARDVLSGKGFDLVKPEELKGIALDQIEAKASELQQERQAMQEDLLRNVLEKQGYEGDALEEMVSEMVARKDAETEQAEATARVRGLPAGTRTPKIDPSKLEGFDAIRASFDQPAKRS